MKRVMEILELEMEMVRLLENEDFLNEDDEDSEDYFEDDDEEWGNTF
jgi:hypothetical protein